MGTACPLCLEREVGGSDALFYFQVAKGGAGGAEGGGDAGWTTVKCRSCYDCRARVVSLQRLRLVMLPFVVLGLLVWPMALPVDGPMQKLGLSFGSSLAVGIAISLVVAGIPLVVIDRANRSMKKALDASWLFRRVHEALGGPVTSADQPEDWRVLASAPTAPARVLDGEEVLAMTKKSSVAG